MSRGGAQTMVADTVLVPLVLCQVLQALVVSSESLADPVPEIPSVDVADRDGSTMPLTLQPHKCLSFRLRSEDPLREFERRPKQQLIFTRSFRAIVGLPAEWLLVVQQPENVIHMISFFRGSAIPAPYPL